MIRSWDSSGLLRNLLEERFALKVHEETRSMETYALVLANVERGPGPGLHPVNVNCETNRLVEGSKPGVFPTDARPPCGRESPVCDWRLVPLSGRRAVRP